MAGGQPIRINDIQDVAAWIHEHDGRIEAWWENQFRLNERVSERLGGFDMRLNALERRLGWIVGFSAAMGSGAVLALQRLIQ